jgi:hypothetical protein
VIDEDIDDPNYVFVLVELHAIRGFAALREAEEGQALRASPLVLLRSGIGIACRASCLGQTLLTTRTGDTIIMVYVRLLASELELFRAAQFPLQVIMVLEGSDGSPDGESATARFDAISLGSSNVALHNVEYDEHGWTGLASRSFAEKQEDRDAFSWVMLSSDPRLMRWDGVTRYNPKERLCAGVIDCDFVPCPSIFVSAAHVRPESIYSSRLLSCASAFRQQLGERAEKPRDQRARAEVVAEFARTMDMPARLSRCTPATRYSMRCHCDDLKRVLERTWDVGLIVQAITHIMLNGEAPVK